MIDTNYTRPNGGRGVSLISRLNARNPHYTSEGVAPTAAEMFNATHWLNDQLDKERIYAADKARKTSQNPMIREIKMRTLLGAGYTQKEALKLASDPSFWRPEWERYGIERPYAVDMQVSGSSEIAQRNKRFAPIDEKLQIEDYIDQHRFERDLEQRKKQVEALPEVYARRGATSKAPTGGTTRRASTGSGGDEQAALLEAANRERILATGKPARVTAGNPAMDYIGNQLSQQLYKAKSAIDNEAIALSNAKDDVDTLAANMVRAKNEHNNALSLDLFQQKQAAEKKAHAIEDNWKKLSVDYDAIANRASGYGLEMTGDNTVFDASTGSVQKYQPYSTKEDLARTPINPNYAPERLNKIQMDEIAGELRGVESADKKRYRPDTEYFTDPDGVKRAVVPPNQYQFDEESDYFNPGGARATAIASLKSGRGYHIAPITDPVYTADFSDDNANVSRLKIGDAPTGKFRPTYSRGNDYFIRRQTANAAADRFIEKNPELTRSEALYLADQQAQKHMRPYRAPVADAPWVQPPPPPSPWDEGIDWDYFNAQNAEDIRQHNFQAEDLIGKARNRNGYDYTLGGY